MIGIFRKLDDLLEGRLRSIRYRNAMRAILFRDNVKQIEWRLSLCESILPHDAKCALAIARGLNASRELQEA